jgi:gluconolactonase|tara:strand:+ start:106 stop:993 length:888 start_codon:yes stop_codon:yes gene_type:complete
MEFSIVSGPFGGITEGPAWDGQSLLFTHIDSSKILAYDPIKRVTCVYRENTNFCNGTIFNNSGRYFGCEGGSRRVVEYTNKGTSVISDNFNGQTYNIPNDLAIDTEGSIWFTDPFYEGVGGEWSKDRRQMELDHESVYKIPKNKNSFDKSIRVTFDTTRPNGLLFNLDHSVLYVAQSGRNPDEERQLRGYSVQEDGLLGEYEVLHDFGQWRGIDGMVLDVKGNIWATAGTAEGGPGPSIYVFSPQGEIQHRYHLNIDRPTNCTFAGSNLDTLYVTTIGGHLLMAQTSTQGRIWYP